MIKIIATIILWIMCYLIGDLVAYKHANPRYLFLWGWVISMTTGAFINWFVKAIKHE